MSRALPDKPGFVASIGSTIVSMFKDVSLSAINAGFVTVLASPVRR